MLPREDAHLQLYAGQAEERTEWSGGWLPSASSGAPDGLPIVALIVVGHGASQDEGLTGLAWRNMPHIVGNASTVDIQKLLFTG